MKHRGALFWTVSFSHLLTINSRQIYGTVVTALVSLYLTLLIITRFHDKITINSITVCHRRLVFTCDPSTSASASANTIILIS